MTKTFWRFEDATYGQPYFIVVAADLDHAKRILRESGCEFGDPSVPFDALAPDAYKWTEISDERAASLMVHFDDAPPGVEPRVPLSECLLGDWFGDEW